MTAPVSVLPFVPQLSEAARLFRELYRGHDGVLELRTFGPEGKSAAAKNLRNIAYRLRDFVHVKNGVCDAGPIQKFISGCTNANLGAFFGVALRSQASLKTRKGDAAHCQVMPALFLDADFKHLGEDETRRRIAACPLPPSMVVESGGGLHIYWILKQPFYLKKERVEAKRWLRHIAASVADVVDEAVSESVRVLRVPDSYNFKPEYDEPRLVTLSVYEPQRVYSLDQIREAWGEPETEDAKPFSVPETIPKGDRHTLLFKFLRSQKARNVSLDVALVGCHAMNEHHCKPPLKKKELDDYLRRVWDQANSPEFDKKKAQQEGPERFDDVPVDGEETKKLTCIPFTTIENKNPEHVFGKRLYRGSPTLLVGEGGVAKGFLLAYVAAQFTRGLYFVDELPSEHRYTRASNVAVLLTEDADSMFKGRFEAAGGDIKRIVTLSSTEQVAGMDIRSPVFLEDDLAELIRELKEREIDLLIIETLVEHMGNRTGKRLPNTSNELEVRNQLRRLLAVCQAADIYCIAVMHPRKGNTGKAIESPSGSRGFTNAARSVLFCYMDPPTDEKPAEDNPVRLLSTGKANYVAKEPPTLRFKVNSFIGDALCGCADLRECEHPARVDWFTGDELYDDRTAQEVVETEQEGERKHPPAKQKAMNLLGGTSYLFKERRMD